VGDLVLLVFVHLLFPVIHRTNLYYY